jgi:hypothetical protein
MRPGAYLDQAVERVPLAEHVGKSGAALERVVLADGRRLVVKRLSPATDLVMALTGDDVGREYLLWSSGVLDTLPAGVGHAVVDGWRETDCTVVVMRDLGDAVLTWRDRLSRDRWLFLLTRVTRMYRAFLGRAPEGLTPLTSLVGMFSPRRLEPHAADANPLARLALRGWQIFEDTAPDDVAGPVMDLLGDPAPLTDALAARPTTLVHGDLATVNMAFEGDGLTLLDWALPSAGPAATDLVRFIAGCSSVVEVTREQMIEDFRRLAGPAHDEAALRLALLGGLIWLGWNKALDAADNPDPATRERERADLAWWLREARATLESGLL